MGCLAPAISAPARCALLLLGALCWRLGCADGAEGQRFLLAAARVSAAISGFDRLRSTLAREPADNLEALRLALTPAETALLEGEARRSRDLEERFAALRRRATELVEAFVPEEEEKAAAGSEDEDERFRVEESSDDDTTDDEEEEEQSGWVPEKDEANDAESQATEEGEDGEGTIANQSHGLIPLEDEANDAETQATEEGEDGEGTIANQSHGLIPLEAPVPPPTAEAEGSEASDTTAAMDTADTAAFVSDEDAAGAKDSPSADAVHEDLSRASTSVEDLASLGVVLAQLSASRLLPWADIATLGRDLDLLAGDLEAHLASVRGLAFSHLPVARRGAQPSPPSAAAPSAAAAAPPGAAKAALRKARAAIDELSAAAKDFASPEPLLTARRLAARLERVAGSGEGTASVAIEATALAREASEALSLAYQQASDGPDDRAETRFQGSAAKTATPVDTSSLSGVLAAAANAGCTEEALELAGKRFDDACFGFRSKMIKQVMLPPESENLKRVVHNMEAMRHSLLSELRGEGTMVPNLEDLVAECGRFIGGSQQLENDLRHYQQLADQQRETRRAARNRKRTLDGGSNRQSKRIASSDEKSKLKPKTQPQRPLEKLSGLNIGQRQGEAGGRSGSLNTFGPRPRIAGV